MIKSDHLKDIDFRSREERQTNMVSDLTDWYEELQTRQSIAYSDTVQAQITMLSSVLWYLLPKIDYRKLTKLRT